MKKLRLALSFILCIFIAIGCTFSAFAKGIEYHLDDLGLSIEIPVTMTVKTGESLSDSEAYLIAASADNSFEIGIYMEPSPSIETFVGLSESDLSQIKEKFEEEGFTSGKIETYGNVPFLDFSRSITDENQLTTYIRQSVTVVDSMQISVLSSSEDDIISSDERSLIRECLESIRFDSVKQQQIEEKKETSKNWVLSIMLIVIAVGIVVAVVIIRKKIAKKKTLLALKNKNADYNVFKEASSSADTPKQKQIGGYQHSSDFFSEQFDTPAPAPQKPATEQTEKKKAGAITRMGYFAKNLGREINKAKKQNNAKKSNRQKSNAKNKRKTVDYDIFSEK